MFSEHISDFRVVPIIYAQCNGAGGNRNFILPTVRLVRVVELAVNYLDVLNVKERL